MVTQKKQTSREIHIGKSPTRKPTKQQAAKKQVKKPKVAWTNQHGSSTGGTRAKKDR